MVKINLNIDGKEQEFNIPEGWTEVTVEQSMALYAMNREDKTDIELVVEVISILSKMDEEFLYMMTPDDFNKLVNVVKFTNDEVKGELADSVMIGDEEYFLKKDFNLLTMGEIISIESIMKQHNNNHSAATLKLLCIFLRKKIDGELESFRNTFMQREELFKELIITDVNNLFLFFLDGKDLLESNMKESLENPE